MSLDAFGWKQAQEFEDHVDRRCIRFVGVHAQRVTDSDNPGSWAACGSDWIDGTGFKAANFLLVNRQERHFEFTMASGERAAAISAGLVAHAVEGTSGTVMYINSGYDTTERIMHCRDVSGTGTHAEKIIGRRFSKLDGNSRCWINNIGNHHAIMEGSSTKIRTCKLSLAPRVKVHDEVGVGVDYTDSTKKFKRQSGGWTDDGGSAPVVGDWIYVQGFSTANTNISHLVAAVDADEITITTAIGADRPADTSVKIYKTLAATTFDVLPHASGTASINGNSQDIAGYKKNPGFYQIGEGLLLAAHQSHSGVYFRYFTDPDKPSSGINPQELSAGCIHGQIYRNLPKKFRILPQETMQMGFFDLYVELLRNNK